MDISGRRAQGHFAIGTVIRYSERPKEVESVKLRRLSSTITVEFAIDVSSSPTSQKLDPGSAQRALFQSVNSWLSDHPAAIVLGINLIDSWEGAGFDGIMKIHLTVEEKEVPENDTQLEPSSDV